MFWVVETKPQTEVGGEHKVAFAVWMGDQTFLLFKVIEVFIRSEEGLSRDMVKHLNSIEEQILESLAWTKDSALWEALQASENKVPTCEEVCWQANN